MKILLILLLACLFGPSFLLIKICLIELSPLQLVCFRLTIGALTLFPILLIRYRSVWKARSLWKHLAIQALLSAVVPFICLSYAETLISSSLASITNGLTPIFSLILAYLILNEMITKTKIAGIFMGLIGLCFIFVPTFTDSIDGNGLGVFLVIIASLCYALGFAYARKFLFEIPPILASAMQIFFASIESILILLFLGELPINQTLSIQCLGSIFFLGFLGTGLAFLVYFKVLKSSGTFGLTMMMFLLPVIGSLLGIFILNEHLYWYSYIGCGCILLGMLTVNQVFTKKKHPKIDVKP